MKRYDLFKCSCCNAYLEVVFCDQCDCVPECCGDPMKKLDEKTADAATEKHVPVIEKVEGGYKVTVGSIPHPMEEDHYIEWIELMVDDRLHRQYLKPGMAPEACFCVCQDAKTVSAREHCNKHGLWLA